MSDTINSCGSDTARRVVLERVISSRYPQGRRPVSWEERRSGVEHVRCADGRELALFSNGGQSTPASGWELLLTRKRDDASWEWTLYGIRPE